MTAASDADLNHLFGIKKPFLAPLHLSILNGLDRAAAAPAAPAKRRHVHGAH